MRKKFLIASALLLPNCVPASLSLGSGITLGPVFNWNIGPAVKFSSWGFNAYYWNLQNNGLPVSIGGGFEFAATNHRLWFAEVQTGVIYAGASIGYAFSSLYGPGFQGSAWLNALAGVNCRYRIFEDQNLFSPGFYLSLPLISTSGSLN